MDKAGATTFLYDFCRDRFREACFAVTGTQGELRYGKVVNPELDNRPANGTYWARITTQVVAEDQESLRNETRRFKSSGIVFVQLFCPVADSKAPDNLDKISESVRNAFRIYQGAEIEFTNAQINDSVAAEPNWLRANVTSTYQYRQFM